MSYASKSILQGRNCIGSVLNNQGYVFERMLCKQPPQQPKQTPEKTEPIAEQPKQESNPAGQTPEQPKRAPMNAYRYMNELKQELETAKPFDSMPKLPMVPFFGSAWLYFPIIGKYNSSNMYEGDLHKQRTYGDVVRERFGKFEIVSSYHPGTNRLLMRHEGRYPARAEFTSLKTYREMRKEWYQPLGLVAMQGPEWEDFRLKIVPHVYRRNLDNDAIAEVAKELVDLVRESRDDKSEIPDLIELLKKWALESIARVALDTRLGCLDPNMEPESDGMRMINSVKTQLACMNKLEASSGNFPFWKYMPTPTWMKFLKAADVFTVLVFKYIKLTLDKYFSNKDKMKETTILQKMLMDERLDVSATMVAVADLIMAGIDTTSHTAGYFLYNLAKNPEKQERLYKEVMKIFPDRSQNIRPTMIQYYLHCFSESMRLLPAVRGNLRIFDRDVVLHGYRIPAGTAVLCVQQVYGRDDRFFDKPNEYRPERYENNEKHSPLMPFGIGKRSCVGEVLARREIFALVCEVLRNYRLEYDYEDIKMRTALVNIPDRPIKVKFIER